jgi:hypothetical protein
MEIPIPTRSPFLSHSFNKRIRVFYIHCWFFFSWRIFVSQSIGSKEIPGHSHSRAFRNCVTPFLSPLSFSRTHAYPHILTSLLQVYANSGVYLLLWFNGIEVSTTTMTMTMKMRMRGRRKIEKRKLTTWIIVFRLKARNCFLYFCFLN